MPNTNKIFTIPLSITQLYNKSFNKIITGTLTTDISSYSVTTEVSSITYDGTAPLGLGSQQGSLFTITVVGTFSDFSISIGGKTLSYSNTSDTRTVIIDNVNGTVTDASFVNEINHMSGDTDEFLKLVNGINSVTISTIGSADVNFKFDFNELYY